MSPVTVFGVSDDPPASPPVRSRGADRSGMALVFILVIVFSYSEEFVGGVFELVGNPEPRGWRWLVLPVDMLIVAATGWLKWRIAARDGGGQRLWGWWVAGALITIAVDVVLLAREDDTTFGEDLVASTLFIGAMAILLISALNADPMAVFSANKRAALRNDWFRARSVVPLVIGTYAAYIAATIWADVLDPEVVRELDAETEAEIAALPLTEQQGLYELLCWGAVNPAFFAQVSGVIPLLLVTLGIEFGYFRHAFREPAQRAATIITVALLCVGLVFSLSAVLKDAQGCGDVLPAWHEYLAFVVSVQATAIGLATLVWLLVVNSPEEQVEEYPAAPG